MKILIDIKEIEETERFYKRLHQVQKEYLDYWLDNTLWDWEFWLSISLTIVPWVIWFVLRKRGSEARLLLAGSFTIIIASWLDFIGVITGLWHYSGKALPSIPSYFPWDFSLIPVTIMLWLQYKPTLHPLIKAIIYAGLTAFVGEYIFELVGLYSSNMWNPFFSFPIYVIIYLLAYRISNSESFKKL